MPEFSWIDLCESKNSTNIKLANDAVSPAIPIGFRFNFYGINYSNIYISANGFISFNADARHGCCNGEPIPNNDAVNNMIAGLWDDLSPSG